MSRLILYIPFFCFSLVRGFAQEKILVSEVKKALPANSQTTFNGRITDAKTGEALSGASIIFPDLKIGTYADNAGKFQFAEIPVGHYLIEVSHVGYISIIEHIDIDRNFEKNFALQPSILENQGVIVTGVSNATNTRKAPIPVTAMRRAEILQSSSTNIIDMLAKKPGISQLGTGPGISKPVIRGLGSNSGSHNYQPI